jgi:hypothetical protein
LVSDAAANTVGAPPPEAEFDGVEVALGVELAPAAELLLDELLLPHPAANIAIAARAAHWNLVLSI